MAGLINLKLLTDFFNKIGPKRISLPLGNSVAFGTDADIGLDFMSTRP